MTDRRCGDCTLCCKVMAVEMLGKRVIGATVVTSELRLPKMMTSGT